MPKETIISQVLLPLLERYDYVDVPGLGRFSFHHLPASIDETNHEVYPPIRSLKLDTKVHGEHDIYYLVQSRESAKTVKKLKSRIDHCVNELINLGRTSIPGFVTIERKEDGIIDIVDIDPAIGGYRQYLPAISLTPRDHTAVKIENEKPISASTNINSTTIDKKNGGPVWQPYLLPLLFLAVSTITIVLFWKSCVQPDSETKIVSVAQDSTKKIEQPSYVDSTTSLFSNENLAQYADILTADLLRDGCTIVVGSFSDRNRSIQRASQVRSFGYTIDDIPLEKPYRVIIRFDCSQYDLNDYLIEVREKVDASAWYLQPEGYDPFD